MRIASVYSDSDEMNWVQQQQMQIESSKQQMQSESETAGATRAGNSRCNKNREL
ncbi:hypothetical protein [Methanolapillus millepedarum]|uniref:hypothetical protein n=1 Tax=Methanolapillus millepedarum TaxID=3028296 RepID=UPI0030B8A1E4